MEHVSILVEADPRREPKPSVLGEMASDCRPCTAKSWQQVAVDIQSWMNEHDVCQ